ncbi:MAG TPA: AsmA-like C-terminal region-containing protein, partial [Opitutales bacterium]|nr:AsmA-like C-terminal region-containing protein [Opitutales bacterium]
FAREPYRVEFSADVPEGVTGWTARFRLHGWDMDGRGMPVDWAIVSGFVNAESLFCDDVQLYTRGSWAKGTFRQDLSNLDWRMDLRGHIYPPEIGPALGRWWNPLWNEFTFDGQRVDADLTISGNWHDRHYANIKGSVAMHHLLYNGVRINEGRLNLYTGNGFVSLRDLHAESDSGNLDGEISWILKPDDLFDVALRLKSGMPVADLDKAFGSTMSSEVKEWTLATPPSVSLLGNISRLGPAQWTRTIYADAGAGAGSWRSIPFHSLRAQIWSGGGSTVIRVPEAVLLGGTMRADIVISGTGGDSRISMKIALSETEFTPTLAALQSLGGSKGDSQLQDRAGLARLDLVGSALIRDIPGTLDASGSFLVHDAELGKIKVFGALSTLLSGVGLNYGTFSLDAVRGSFRIGGGVAQLRDTQITGPAIRVDAKGSVKLADSGLDFDVKVFLLSNDKPSVMNLIGVILSPFGYILELSLKGSFDDPAWRFKLDPRNIFDRGGDTGATQTPKAAETPAASPAAAR